MLRCIVLMFLIVNCLPAKAQEAGIGIFEQRTDIGKVAQAGSVHYDKGKQTYGITGSGENMWFATDACSFVWKKWEGDVALSAAVHLVGKGKDPHRKACLMIRQGLEPDAAYVDVAVHGDGLISLQLRDTKGANTHEVQVNVVAPVLVQLVKRGSYALCYTQEAGKELKFSGAAVRIDFTGPTYVGLGVCAHDKTAQETALFVNVSLSKPTASESKPVLYSTLEYQSLASTDRRVVFVTPKKIEAPNWMPDGKSLLFNGEGKLHRIAVTGGTPETVNTGFAIRCNNDHGISPDGKQIVISDQSQTDRKSRIYTLPITGGEPKLITPLAPSYWHGWSPDGRRLAYCAERNKEFNIYTIGVDGGEETRLTTAKGLDDGPEYSPDGKHIYFNSDRTGLMQIWRMNTDGSEQTQLFNDEYNNWFPHPSPDGKTVVFLSYDKSVKGHPENKDVMLRRLNLATNKIDVLAKLFGGQGTINVPCFSPDGRRIAFMTYQWIP